MHVLHHVLVTQGENQEGRRTTIKFTRPPRRLVPEPYDERAYDVGGPSEPPVPTVPLTREALLAHGGHADPLRRALAESMARPETHCLTMPEEVEHEAGTKAREFMGHREYKTTIMPWDCEREPLGDYVEAILFESSRP